MKKIGLTGGIGAGKSYIARIFEAIGVPIFYADDEAKKILNLPNTLTILNQQFSMDVIDHTTGLANRKLLAALVFNDTEKLQLLNSIIHPLVEEAFQLWCKQHAHQVYVLKEAAILFESGSYKNLDGVICVEATMQERVSRVMKRDELTYEEVMKRINNQWTDDQRSLHSHWVIRNNYNEQILPQVLSIHQQILAM